MHRQRAYRLGLSSLWNHQAFDGAGDLAAARSTSKLRLGLGCLHYRSDFFGMAFIPPVDLRAPERSTLTAISSAGIHFVGAVVSSQCLGVTVFENATTRAPATAFAVSRTEPLTCWAGQGDAWWLVLRCQAGRRSQKPFRHDPVFRPPRTYRGVDITAGLGAECGVRNGGEGPFFPSSILKPFEVVLICETRWCRRR